MVEVWVEGSKMFKIVDVWRVVGDRYMLELQHLRRQLGRRTRFGLARIAAKVASDSLYLRQTSLPESLHICYSAFKTLDISNPDTFHYVKTVTGLANILYCLIGILSAGH
jgi:hypothetical protein